MDGGPTPNPQLMNACPSNYYNNNYNSDNESSGSGAAVINKVVYLLKGLGDGEDGLFFQVQVLISCISYLILQLDFTVTTRGLRWLYIMMLQSLVYFIILIMHATGTAISA
jgi:hypothetical protein